MGFSSVTVVGMKTSSPHKNTIRPSDCCHPVDILEPLPNREEGIQRTCEVLRRIFGWVSEGGTLEQRGLRASVVLYCVQADLIEEVTLEELSTQAGFPQATVENLIAEFCHTIDWK